MKLKLKHILILAPLLLAVIIYVGCSPVREFYTFRGYNGANNFDYKLPAYNPAKKTVLLVADNEGTEIFDLMAPFYLFNLTQKANVYIVAEKKYPVIVRKGFYALPHYTYREIDSLHIRPEVMVVPALSPMDAKHQDSNLVKWIKNTYSGSTKLLSVCVGALTAAKTGLYDGKPMTTHALEYTSCKKQFDNPTWVNNISVTQSGNLYSTAGVSNAVEGSLTIIRDLFGEEVMHAVLDNIRYPNATIKVEHRSIELNTGSKLTIANKIYFKKNRKIGVLLQNGIDEFTLAAVLDTYHRTFPGSIETFTTNGNAVTSKFGLTVIPTGKIKEIKKLDELHVLRPDLLTKSEEFIFSNIPIVKYSTLNKEYIINLCLKRINEQYGDEFENIVRSLLDYN